MQVLAIEKRDCEPCGRLVDHNAITSALHEMVLWLYKRQETMLGSLPHFAQSAPSLTNEPIFGAS